jgi:uncharacterized protein DUF6680
MMTMGLVILQLLTILAIVTGPILAIEVQKRLEKGRDALNRKLTIYKTLMATRAFNSNPLHVEALNQIEIEFNPKSNKEKKVIDAWHVLFDHLQVNVNDNDAPGLRAWNERRIELQTRLLSEMGQFLGYSFDEVQIRKGIYYPIRLGTIEDEQHLIRQQFAQVLSGKTSIPMRVTDFPFEPSAESVEAAVRKLMPEVLESHREAKALPAGAIQAENKQG